MLIWIVLAASLAQTAAPAAPTSAPALAPPAQNQPVRDYANAEALLDALEQADAGLDRLQATVRHDVMDDLVGESQVRMGTLYFDRTKPEHAGTENSAAPAIRRFAVKFDKIYLGSALRKEVEIHAFDGRWYAEKHLEEKRIDRREVVAPGDTFDPLKIGEGPLPIPIGQKKADILARYNVELLPPANGLDPKATALLEFVASSVQLRLTPKDTRNDNHKEIRLWYAGKPPSKMSASDSPSGRLLPRLARTEGNTINPADTGNITLIQLTEVKVNADATIDPAIMDTAAPEGWKVTERPLRKSPPVIIPPTPTSPAENPKPPAEDKTDAPAQPPADSSPPSPPSETPKDAPK